MTCSECKFNGGLNSDNQIWCEKKQIYVNTSSEETCSFFEKK
ncbi:MAG: hypothetical protein ACTSRP_20605 [Candidatus Helarchaeota archaeon]